ncbi:hypothetical protein Tco_1230464 [Tanacetum coccineum]
MAQQVIPTAQLVPRFHTIGRCNNYAVLQSISCSPECKIVGQILLDHPLGYVLTATADVHTMYLQQFWRTVSKVPVETPENPFVAPVNIETIEAFMNRVGYQGVVDKVSAFYMKNLAQPWQTMFKVFNRCLTTRTSGHDQTKINILQMFHAVINRTNVDYAALLWIKEDYHSIKDDIPLEIRATDDFKEYETVFMNVDVPMNQPQPSSGEEEEANCWRIKFTQKSLKITIRQQKVVKGEKDDDDFTDRLEPGSHKDNPKHVDDDDDKYKEKVDEEEGGEMGSLETRTEEMQTPIPTKLRSPRTILSSDKNITQELTDTVPLPTTTTSNTPHSKRRISSKYSHLPGALRRMCRRQGYMIQNMERKCVTTKQFWKTHKQVNQVLHEGVSQLAEKATEDLIENNLKPCIAATIIEDRDAFRSEVPDLVSQEFNAQAPKIIEDLFKKYEAMLFKTSNVNVVCATCGKYVFNSNHDAFVSKFINDIVQLILFIVDSGCTKHMTGNLKLLCNFEISRSKGFIRSKASITISSQLVNFCDTDLEVAFMKSTCFVRDLQENDLLTGKAKRSTFKTKFVPTSKGRLNLLHMDLCDPMRVESINEKK